MDGWAPSPSLSPLCAVLSSSLLSHVMIARVRVGPMHLSLYLDICGRRTKHNPSGWLGNFRHCYSSITSIACAYAEGEKHLQVLLTVLVFG